MDCSDFSFSVYLTVLEVNIGPNTSTQIGRGVAVSAASMKPGDLIFLIGMAMAHLTMLEFALRLVR